MKTLAERFIEKTIPVPFSGCWIWMGALSSKGYGSIRISKKTYIASRVSFVIYKGTIPNGLCILHSCDIPSCVNPDHLRLGTHFENIQDMISKKRDVWSNFSKKNNLKILFSKMRKGKNLGSNNSNAKFSEENILKIRSLRKEGINQTQIAKMFCTTQNRISEIVNRKTWRNI